MGTYAVFVFQITKKQSLRKQHVSLFNNVSWRPDLALDLYLYAMDVHVFTTSCTQ